MGVGPNYVLDKGFLATGATAYAVGEIAKVVVGTGAFTTTMNAIVRNSVLGAATTADTMWVVVMEDLDTVRLATAKAFIDCRLMGIARVLVGAAVTAGKFVTADTTARAVPITKAVAGAQPIPALGYALTGNATVGGFIDVLLTPGASI